MKTLPGSKPSDACRRQLLLAASLLPVGRHAAAQAPGPAPALMRSHGLRINVPDMAAALTFYAGVLGFVVASREAFPAAVTLAPDARHYSHVTLVQQAVNAAYAYRRHSQTSVTLRVHDIRAFLARAQREQLKLLEPHVRIEQVGLSISFADPFGNHLAVMDESRKPDPLPPEPSLYNFGLYLPADGYARARDFWCERLGFITQTDRFLPADQVLFSADRRFGFMLHMREGVAATVGDYPGHPQPLMQLATPDLTEVLTRLRAAGVEPLLPAGARDPLGRRLTAFREPFGVPVEVLELS